MAEKKFDYEGERLLEEEFGTSSSTKETRELHYLVSTNDRTMKNIQYEKLAEECEYHMNEEKSVR